MEIEVERDWYDGDYTARAEGYEFVGFGYTRTEAINDLVEKITAEALDSLEA